MTDTPHTVYIRGEIPDKLHNIPAKNLPQLGERVRVVVAATNYCCGLGRVIKVDPKRSTYNLETRGMIPEYGDEK